MKFENQIQYVGTTIQKQTTRLSQGLNGKYSYKWNSLIDKDLTLIVIRFPKNSEQIRFNEIGKNYIDLFKIKLQNQIKDGKILEEEIEKERKKQFIENIEAEIVFNMRNSDKNKKWLEYQHEIHFNNFIENGSKIAENILAIIKDL